MAERDHPVALAEVFMDVETGVLECLVRRLRTLMSEPSSRES